MNELKIGKYWLLDSLHNQKDKNEKLLIVEKEDRSCIYITREMLEKYFDELWAKE